MSRQRSLEQERAGRAWECVQRVKLEGHHYAPEYRSLARSAPADIQANGLGQMAAFWGAKSKGAHEHARLLEDVAGWLRHQLQAPREGQGLVEWIAASASSDEYRRATTEAMAFLGWLKRFAEAELPTANRAEGGRG